MVFVALTGQRDNVGDSLLRRPLLRAAQGREKCHILVGRGAEDWTNLGLRACDKLYTDRRRWVVALIRSALARRTTLLLNSGELIVDRRSLVVHVFMLPVIILLKMRGGALVHSGFGLRDPNVRVPFLVRLIVRMSTVASWRDEASRAKVGAGTVTPDWALSEGPSLDIVLARHEERSDERVLVVSLRGDRPAPSRDWLDSVRRTADTDLNARVIVSCQVRRDRARAEWLAAQLDAELLGWPDEVSHAEQEARLRSAYSNATWVASDRLHAIIMAMTEGAVPLDLVPDVSRKISRVLAVMDLPLFPLERALQRLADDQAQVRLGLRRAQERLARLSSEIDRAVSGVSTSRIRVLHSVPPPDNTTRYARHMAATEDFDIRPVFLGWCRAVCGRYDVFHLHWPEHFVPSGGAPQQMFSRALARVLIARLRRRQIPVIRTLHNIVPHSVETDARGDSLRTVLDQLTRAEIHLVPGDPQVSFGHIHFIPHGSYREPYASVMPDKAIRGRALHFGRLEAYKGVRELLIAMRGSKIDGLRIVGDPGDPDLAAVIRSAARSDPRISYRFGFLVDDDLAREISRSTFCVFPYRELHSSGAILAALSMNRPILVPRTLTTEALQQEVGSDWVRIYDAFGSAQLDETMEWASNTVTSGGRPDLTDRTWQLVRDRHADAVHSVMDVIGSQERP